MREGQTTTLSDFLRHSGDVLRLLDESDVVVTRRGAPNLLLTTAPRAESIFEGLSVLARLTRQLVSDRVAGPRVAALLERAFIGASYLGASERLQLATELAQTCEAAAELGTTEQLHHTVDAWRRTARARARMPVRSAHESRPVAIPDDIDGPSVEKASGVVELPAHVRWTGPRRTYDLRDIRDRRRVYEQVLREGGEEDVRRFIELDKLIADWDELVLPPRVRFAWAQWLRHRGVELAC